MKVHPKTLFLNINRSYKIKIIRIHTNCTNSPKCKIDTNCYDILLETPIENHYLNMYYLGVEMMQTCPFEVTAPVTMCCTTESKY